MKPLLREVAEFVEKDIATAEQRVVEYNQRIRAFNTGKAAGEFRDDYRETQQLIKDLAVLQDRIKQGEVLLEDIRAKLKPVPEARR